MCLFGPEHPLARLTGCANMDCFVRYLWKCVNVIQPCVKVIPGEVTTLNTKLYYYVSNYKIPFVLTLACVISETASHIVTYDIVPPHSA